MTERVPTPEHVVGFIKAVANQDWRERQAAGFKYPTSGVAKRLAKELGLSIHTVKAIMHWKRRKSVWSHRTVLLRRLTVSPERLAEIRKQRLGGADA